MTDAIALPDSGDGSRRARRQAPRRARPAPPRQHQRPPSEGPRRRWPILLLLLVLVAGGVGAWYVTRDDDEDPDASSDAPVAVSRTAGLLVERASDGSLAGATLLIDQGRG